MRRGRGLSFLLIAMMGMALPACSEGEIAKEGHATTAKPHAASLPEMAIETAGNLAAGNFAAGEAVDPRVLFDWQMNCQGCHHPDGAGNAQRGIPPLEALENFQTLPEGREFLIRVPGMSRSPLNDEQLTNLANWMMTEFSTPGAAQEWQPYSLEEVSRLRARPIAVDVVRKREALLKLIAEQSK